MNAILEQINTIGKSFVEFALPMLAQFSILFLILLLIDFLLRKKVRSVFRYWIWMLVLAKLVLPTSLSSPLSLGYLFGDSLTSLQIEPTAPQLKKQPPAVSPQIIDFSTVPPASDTSSVVTSPPNRPSPEQPFSSQSPQTTPLSWQGVVFLLWLAVVAAMGLLLVQRAIFVKGLVAQAVEADDSIKDTFNSCLERIEVRRRIGLKVSTNATSPAVCGLFRAVILLPHNLSAGLSAGQLQAVLLHELVHIKRGDLWVNLVQTVLQILYFYNPLLWIANSIIRRIREQAVDEMVLVAMGENAQQYPQTLVSVAKLAFKRPALSLRLIGVVESKSALASRIKRILARPIPKSTKLGILGLLAVIILAVILLPMAKAQKQAGQMTDVQVEVKSLEFGAVDFKVILPNDVAVELQPGKLVFHGRYQHRSRGQDIEMPSELWIKQNVEGGLKALAYLPWRGSYDLASGDMNHRLESYRSGCDSAVGRTAYSIHLEFGDDKASLTRRGIRQNHNKTELAIPKGASFNPNSRPDSYCADNILLRGLDLSPGQIKELRVYDWDNSGEKLVDYSIHISHAGKELIKVPAGTFEANHLVLKQVTSADTWFKKRAGHITDFWVLDNHIIVRVVRHREPYEMELLEYTYPKDLGGKTEGQKTNVGPGMPHTDSKEKANEAQRRIDAAKWSEGKAMLGTIATAIRAWVAEKSPDGSWDSNSLTFADLGFIKGDLTGTYFDESNFSWIITYNKNIGKLSYTIRATAGKGMKYPSVVTLNQDGQFTQEPHQQTENPAVQVEGKKTADNLNIDESKISPPGRICTL
jgi:beta-lactamase regulating signal transducer with metallopeptidase domain